MATPGLRAARSPLIRTDSDSDSTRASGVLAWGGVVGPVAFATAWATLGASSPGYSPTHDAISLLAATSASTQPAMTAGFVAFGVGVSLYAIALRSTLPGPAWTAA